MNNLEITTNTSEYKNLPKVALRSLRQDSLDDVMRVLKANKNVNPKSLGRIASCLLVGSRDLISERVRC